MLGLVCLNIHTIWLIGNSYCQAKLKLQLQLNLILSWVKHYSPILRPPTHPPQPQPKPQSQLTLSLAQLFLHVFVFHDEIHFTASVVLKNIPDNIPSQR